MSRIGKQPVVIIKGVKVQIQNGVIQIEGTKGKLNLTIPQDIQVEVNNAQVLVKRINDEKKTKSLHGTIRALINNMIKGVSEGYKKELDIIGVGYKAQMKGQNVLALNVGFTHPVEMTVWPDLKVSVPKPGRVVIEGPDKQRVGEFAAKIRKVYPPEPYKGKGIRYAGEEVRKKLGKALAK